MARSLSRCAWSDDALRMTVDQRLGAVDHQVRARGLEHLQVPFLARDAVQVADGLGHDQEGDQDGIRRQFRHVGQRPRDRARCPRAPATAR